MARVADWPTFGREAADVAWRPPPDALRTTRLGRWITALGIGSLEALQARAAADPAWFWDAAIDELGFPWQRRPSTILELERGPEWARWFTDGRFNYATSAVDAPAASAPDAEALAWEGDDGATRRLSRRELRIEVDRAAHAFAALGIAAGDRVGIYLPMLPETAVTVLALAKLRAVYTPIFSGYAAPAVASRLRDCGAKVLITADGFLRRGSVVPMKEAADAAAAETPTMEHVVVVRRTGRELTWDPRRDVWWDEAMAAAPDGPFDAPETDPETPYMLIYTSGTTGRPKGAVHVHGGFPVKGAQDLAHGFDLGPGDALFWYTDLGWMMGPWAISGALLLGARLVLFEGVPDHPGPDRLWSIVERHRVTHLGVSPTAVRALMAHGDEPARAHDRSSLRVLGSTGEPWDPRSWRWLSEVGGDGRLPIVNYSGGTEVSGGIVGCNLLAPIKPASFNGPCIGMAADVFDPGGRPLRGQVGELVVRTPSPGMTRGFWNDPERYLDTYWRRFPGAWVHGDWAIIDPDGYWFILGRSDDTIKVAGKRVGPAEVESAAVKRAPIREAAAIGVPHELKGEVIVLFVVPRDAGASGSSGGTGDGARLRQAVSEAVVAELGKPLKPEAVVVVAELPKTRNGKIMRRVARAAWLGEDPGDLSALENPRAIEAVRGARLARD
jgi:acetyl-CoA synthetase